MGGLNSYLIGCCTSSNNCPENHCKLNITHSNRSFTFNKINDNDFQLENSCECLSNDFSTGTVNINTASENILMTLPGINRKTAHDIILHRQKLGSFKKIEDIALVNGIGAAKFKLMKSEISVGSNENNEMKEILVNELNIFQLTAIPGFTQKLAERIVHFRQKRGPFKCDRDFLRIPGMSQKFLDSFKPYIKLKNSSDAQSPIYINNINNNTSELDDRYLSNESFIKFATGSDSEFNFLLSIWKIENPSCHIPKRVTENAFPDRKPVVLIVLLPEDNSSSIELIEHQLNDTYGINFFKITRCNVGDNCTHYHAHGILTVLSNFHQFSAFVTLNSLIEDSLTCMILKMKVENLLISCVAIFRRLTKPRINEHDEMSLFDDLAVKLISDGEHSYVFLCDLSLIKSAQAAFVNHGFHFSNELSACYDQYGCSIAHIRKEAPAGPNSHLKAIPSSMEPNSNIIQHTFDIIIPFS